MIVNEELIDKKNLENEEICAKLEDAKKKEGRSGEGDWLVEGESGEEY
jgi:hypothetical protein